MKLKEVMTSMDYEKLYKAYYLQVYSYTISLAKNREIAEEITQNTFYKAVSTTSQFKGKSDELTWLCSIAKNLYHDEMRSRQRVADVSEINDLPSNENVENSVAVNRDIRYSNAEALRNASFSRRPTILLATPGGPKRKMLSPATAESRARATICSFSKTLSFSCCNRDAIRGFNVFIKIID